jgi:ribonucrease Y
METVLPYLLGALAALVVAVPAGYLIARVLDRSRHSSAQVDAARITDQAKIQAENILKEHELRAKDELFKKREQFNREIEQARAEVREQERRLEKREDVLDQKSVSKSKNALATSRLFSSSKRKNCSRLPGSTGSRQRRCCWSDWKPN